MIRTCLFLFSLFISLLNLSAQNAPVSFAGKSKSIPVLDRKVTASYRGVQLEKVLEDLSNRYNISFSYLSQAIPLDEKVYASIKNEPLDKLLFQIFRKLPVAYIGLEDQVVLMKKEFADKLAGSEKDDTVSVITIWARSGFATGDIKMSLKDLLKGELKSPFSEQVQLTVRGQDSIITSKAYRDSLAEINHRARKARVKLIRSKEFNPRYGVEILVRAELAYWTIDGALNQSIDYTRFNNYRYPDLSYSESVTVKYRFFNEFYVQPGIGSSNIIRNGSHTDYLINYFNPETPLPVTYSFTSNYNYLAFTLEAGTGIRISKMKILVGGGYWQGILIGKQAPAYLPFFEPKYYITGPPYMNSRLEKLVPERVEYKRFYPGFFWNLKMQYSLSKYMEFLTEVHFRDHYSSIYTDKVSIRERVKLWGVGIGLRVNIL